MISSIKNNIRNFVFNMPGWHTDRKIVVFESDDWGMIRMASREAYQYLLKKGYPVDECMYNRNDTLETNEDLEQLFEVLLDYRDNYGNHPVITANNIVANPDFARIKDAEYESYVYETFDKTLSRYPNRDRVLSLYQEGIKNRIFIPQLHGREHVNISNWLEALKSGDGIARELFEHSMFTAHVIKNNLSCSLEYLDAFGFQYGKVNFDLNEIISEAANIFENTFLYKSQSFIAPCYTWPASLSRSLDENGVKYIQGSTTQKATKENDKGYKKIRHFTGQQNKKKQFYMVRNATFEVAENPAKDWVASCLKEINTAFNYKKPAVISIHRVNFIGDIHPENRRRTLTLFRSLLSKILAYWPETEFMSTPDLGKLVENSSKS